MGKLNHFGNNLKKYLKESISEALDTLGMPSKKKSKLWDIGRKGGRGSKQNPKC